MNAMAWRCLTLASPLAAMGRSLAVAQYAAATPVLDEVDGLEAVFKR